MAVTAQQIAELAGVSRGTVDRALHNRGRVNPEVSARILQIAKDLGYKPNMIGQALVRNKQVFLLGMILQSAETTTMQDVSRGAAQSAEELRASGADLLIKDANLISDVESGMLREVSCGYLCEYVPDGSGYKQQNIRGNHVAVVPRGRAGHEVAIKDQAASEAGKGKKRMKKETKEALYRFFGLAAQDAEPEELEKLTSDLSKVMDSEPEKKEEAPPTGDVMVERAPKGDDLGSTLDRILERLEALEHKNDREEKALHDEDDLDDLEE